MHTTHIIHTHLYIQTNIYTHAHTTYREQLDAAQLGGVVQTREVPQLPPPHGVQPLLLRPVGAHAGQHPVMREVADVQRHGHGRYGMHRCNARLQELHPRLLGGGTVGLPRQRIPSKGDAIAGQLELEHGIAIDIASVVINLQRSAYDMGVWMR